MNTNLEKKHKVILLISFLLVAVIYSGSYYFYIKPLKTSLNIKELQLNNQQKLNEVLLSRISSSEEGALISTAEMQKIVPVHPMIEQLVLDLEKAEGMSGSLITSVEFSDASDEDLNSEGVPVQQDISVSDTENSNAEMPLGLEKTSVKILVESPDYLSLEKFIETIEKLQRFVMVESIVFSGPEEQIRASVSDDTHPISMTLVVNSYYIIGMDDLKDFNPKIEAPEPAKKRNPFPVVAPGEEPAETSEGQ